MNLTKDSREELNRALLKILDFCEERRICLDIKNEYIQRVVNVYDNVNRFVDNEYDVDCEGEDQQRNKLP